MANNLFYTIGIKDNASEIFNNLSLTTRFLSDDVKKLSKVLKNVVPEKAKIKSFKLLSSEIKKTDINTKSFTNTTNKSKSLLAANSSILEKNESNLNDLKSTYSKASSSVDRFTRSIGNNGQELDKLKSKSNSVAKSINKIKSPDLRKFGQTGNNFLSKISGPTMAFNNFDEVMSKLEAKAFTGVDISDKEKVGKSYGEVEELRREKRKEKMSPLRSQARHLGLTTSFSEIEVGKGQVELAGSGMSGAQIEGSTKGLLEMAKAGDMALDRTASLSTGLLNIYQMDKSEIGISDSMARIGDVLAKTSSDTKTNFSEMSYVFEYAGAGASALGLSIEKTASFVSALANNNIRASKAGTSLRKVFSSLAAPTTAGATMMEQYGVKRTDGSGNLRDATDIMEELAQKTSHLGNAEKARMVKVIFGATAQSGAIALLREASKQVEVTIRGEKKRISSLRNLERGYESAGGYAKRMAKIMEDNAKNSTIQLGSAISGLNTTLGRAFSPSIVFVSDAIKGLSVSLSNVIDEFPKFSSAMGGVVLAGSGVLSTLGAIGASTMASKLVFSGFGSVLLGSKKAFAVASLGMKSFGVAARVASLALLTNPIGLTIVGIASGIALCVTYWDDLKKAFESTSNFVTDIFGLDQESKEDSKPKSYNRNSYRKPIKTLNKMTPKELENIGVNTNSNSNVLNAPINITVNGEANPQDIGRAVYDSLLAVEEENQRKHGRRNYD